MKASLIFAVLLLICSTSYGQGLDNKKFNLIDSPPPKEEKRSNSDELLERLQKLEDRIKKSAEKGADSTKTVEKPESKPERLKPEPQGSRPRVGEYVTDAEGNYVSGELPPGETHESMKPKKVSRKDIDADREMICDGTSCRIVPKTKPKQQEQASDSGVKAAYGVYRDNLGGYRYAANDGYGDWAWDGVSWVRNIPAIPVQQQPVQMYYYNDVVVPQQQYYYSTRVRRPRYSEYNYYNTPTYNYSIPMNTYNYTPSYNYSSGATDCPTCNTGG